MFFSNAMLVKKGALAKIWLAAHFTDKKLTRAHVDDTNINEAVKQILTPAQAFALRLSGQLLLGVCRIYQKKVKYVQEDCFGLTASAFWRPGGQAAESLKDPVLPQAAGVGASQHNTNPEWVDPLVDDLMFGEAIDPNIMLRELEDDDFMSSSAATSSLLARSAGSSSRYSHEASPAPSQASSRAAGRQAPATATSARSSLSGGLDEPLLGDDMPEFEAFVSAKERLSSASTVSTQPLTDDLAARLDDELPLISLEADGRGGRVAGSPSGSGKDADLHLRSIERGRRDASGSGEVELPNIEFDIDLPPLGDDLPPSARKSADEPSLLTPASIRGSHKDAPASMTGSVGPIDLQLDQADVNFDIDIDLDRGPAQADAGAEQPARRDDGKEQDNEEQQASQAKAKERKRRVPKMLEADPETTLSSEVIRAALNDRSDLYGPRPLLPLTKRARILAYREHPQFVSHALSNVSPMLLSGWSPILLDAFHPFFTTGKPAWPSRAVLQALATASTSPSSSSSSSSAAAGASSAEEAQATQTDDQLAARAAKATRASKGSDEVEDSQLQPEQPEQQAPPDFFQGPDFGDIDLNMGPSGLTDGVEPAAEEQVLPPMPPADDLLLPIDEHEESKQSVAVRPGPAHAESSQLEEVDEEEVEESAAAAASAASSRPGHRQASDFNQRTRKMYSLLQRTFATLEQQAAPARQGRAAQPPVTVTITHAELLRASSDTASASSSSSSESTAPKGRDVVKKAAAAFYELLVLKTHDYVNVEQAQPFADIVIQRGPLFGKESLPEEEPQEDGNVDDDDSASVAASSPTRSVGLSAQKASKKRVSSSISAVTVSDSPAPSVTSARKGRASKPAAPSSSKKAKLKVANNRRRREIESDDDEVSGVEVSDFEVEAEETDA